MQEKKPNIMRRLYDWTVSWADKPQGTQVLAALSFAESSFFPIPPDVLLIPLVFGAPKRWWKIALVCTVASVLGGVFGWYIGKFFWQSTQDFFFTYIFSKEAFEAVENMYGEYAFLAILGAAFTPIPYKVFTIAAGVCNISLPILIAASIVGRGGRFFLVAIIIYFVGPRAKPWIEKYFNTLATAFFILLVLGFVVIKYLL